MGSSGLLGLTLELGERQTLAAAHTTDVIVMFNPLLVVFITTGRVDVLNANIDLLLDDTSSYSLVDQNTKGMIGYIVYSASLSMVGLVWHTFLECTITLYINEVLLLITCQVGLQMLYTILLETTGKHVPGSTTNSLRISHLDLLTYTK